MAKKKKGTKRSKSKGAQTSKPKIVRAKTRSKKKVVRPKSKKKVNNKFLLLARLKRWFRKISKIQVRGQRVFQWKIVVPVMVMVGFLVWLFWGVPLPTELGSRNVPISTKLFDRNGNLIFEIYADQRSDPLPLDEIPDDVINATIAVEDKDFYNHFGISIVGITRAAYNTVFKQKLQGGSTLTQQLVKNSLLTPERTIQRKLRELALTIVVEVLYSKDEILESYLNRTPYGSTAYGVEVASELYFGKSVKDLNLAEAATLAGLPQAPTRFSPFGANPELAKGRQETVLRRMVEDEYISQEQMDEALEYELKYIETGAPAAPHFALWVKEMLAAEYGDAVVEQGGLRVTTTLDLDLQEKAQAAVAEEVAELSDLKVGNGAAVVIRPRSGEILAMVGSKDYFAEDEDGKVNIIFASRQPGSSIKPLNYALAIEDERLTASTPMADVPTCFSVYGQRAYCPVNYDGSYHGAQQVRFALANSYNIPAVRVLAVNGLENFVDFAHKMGITTFTDPDQYGLSLTLGGGEVRPIDMATAFGVFANGGIKQDPIAILKVEDYRGKKLMEVDVEELEGDRVLSAETSFIISHILHDNNARAAAFGTGSFLNVKGHPEASVKTGTTNDLRDNWTVGYTRDAVVAVWVGNNDNTPMGGAVSGLAGASPIWNRIMQDVLDKAEEGFYNPDDEGHGWPLKPDGVVGSNVCATTGNLPGGDEGNPDCPTRFEYFLRDAVGARIESGMRDVQIDKTNGQLAHPELAPDLVETQNHPFLLDPLGTLVCLDCPIASHSATLSYPFLH